MIGNYVGSIEIGSIEFVMSERSTMWCYIMKLSLSMTNLFLSGVVSESLVFFSWTFESSLCTSRASEGPFTFSDVEICTKWGERPKWMTREGALGVVVVVVVVSNNFIVQLVPFSTIRSSTVRCPFVPVHIRISLLSMFPLFYYLNCHAGLCFLRKNCLFVRGWVVNLVNCYLIWMPLPTSWQLLFIGCLWIKLKHLLLFFIAFILFWDFLRHFPLYNTLHFSTIIALAPSYSVELPTKRRFYNGGLVRVDIRT